MTQTETLPLLNKHIMVTRPAHQAEQLISLLKQAGASVYCQPLIEIVPLAHPVEAIECVRDFGNTDIAVFISQNAVTHGVNLINEHGALPTSVKLATVGLGSAKLLEHLTHRHVEITPQGQYNSEQLLKHPLMQDVATKIITIFRGIGGRNLLADTLRKRGATVHYAEVYQRHCPEIDLHKLQRLWADKPIDAICITSGEGLQNLAKTISLTDCPTQLREDILNCQLVIVNQRLEALANKNGFYKKPMLSENVSDQAIVDVIIKQMP